MEKKLSAASYLTVGSMLFGLFFGAGNLIFPVHMGQEAGSAVGPATLGFLITAIGLPFLGVAAIGVSKSSGLFDLAGRVHPVFGYAMTILLYLTIGPLFALPRTATVSYEIGVDPFVPDPYKTAWLACFSILFFAAALFFALRPSKILTSVGKILNPLFLVFLAVLIVTSLARPMGSVGAAQVQGAYRSVPFFKGFTEGYNTMDALASLTFGIIVVRSLRGLGLKSPRSIAAGTLKSGFISMVLMGLIYGFLGYIGASSMGRLKLSENGGIALAQVARYYFSEWGGVLLAVIVTLACLKTAVGLITACAETFQGIFPNLLGYRACAVLFTAVSCLIANVGLTQIIAFSIPVLMLLYPLAIALILLALLSPLFHNRRCVSLPTILFTLFDAAADCLNALPQSVTAQPAVRGILDFYRRCVPFFSIGMGWIVPLLAGLGLGLILYFCTRPALRASRAG
ncbi:MAG TPA: branched-chain amino acid transport system II carrier protein [Ruminococcaceae bacterium]|jgi:LIVCS family branched-chain amino acid:cation transporter|nr:branched-chain amino acid transport system II carrier protein [Oscillospiraceae bacterium]